MRACHLDGMHSDSTGGCNNTTVPAVSVCTCLGTGQDPHCG